jgi:hypothetical protein
MEKLPLYEFTLTQDSDGVEAVAFVDAPAIEVNWKAFDKQTPIRFAIQNEEKRIVASPIMIADLPIYRRDNTHGEYMCVFRKDTIEQIVQKFSKNNLNNSVNKMHDPNQKVDGVYLYQSFIINSEMGINTPNGFDTLADGSWFGFYKIENDAVWNDVKNGVFKGVSVEGFFDSQLLEAKSDIDLLVEEIESLTAQLHAYKK